MKATNPITPILELRAALTTADYARNVSKDNVR